jgi:hypothetical protein
LAGSQEVTDGLRGKVRAAGEGLVEDLRPGEEATRSWLEAELGDLLVEAALSREPLGIDLFLVASQY